jgi:hypothetical protein
MFANQATGSILHGSQIERIADVPRGSAGHYIPQASGNNSILVTFVNRVADRMKTGGGPGDVFDDNVVGDVRVDRSLESFTIKFAGGLQTADLPPRVNAGIGSATGRDPDLFTGDRQPALFESFLN